MVGDLERRLTRLYQRESISFQRRYRQDLFLNYVEFRPDCRKWIGGYFALALRLFQARPSAGSASGTKVHGHGGQDRQQDENCQEKRKARANDGPLAGA
jgi:hypothetical protein